MDYKSDEFSSYCRRTPHLSYVIFTDKDFILLFHYCHFYKLLHWTNLDFVGYYTLIIIHPWWWLLLVHRRCVRVGSAWWGGCREASRTWLPRRMSDLHLGNHPLLDMWSAELQSLQKNRYTKYIYEFRQLSETLVHILHIHSTTAVLWDYCLGGAQKSIL